MDIRVIKIKDGVGTYRIVHTKTGLFFNGYDNYSKSKGKNTLSIAYSKKFASVKDDDIEILNRAFEGNIVIKDEKKYVRNIIVYAGCEIHKILSNHYDEYEYLPIEDFIIERII
jgi:hypothetical protein